MSPVSMPTSVSMVVTPATFSPFRMHQLMGAEPRYFGSSDACTFTVPYWGMESISLLSSWPKAAVTTRSGFNPRRQSTPSWALIFSN